MPTFTVVAGPNGSGKSTLTKWNRETFQSISVLDPDAVAKTLWPLSGEADASVIDAGRAVLTQAKELLRQRQSFLIETTLSGGTYIRMMKEARDFGYHVILFYIGTTSLQVNLERVRIRVLKGGHDVPEQDQRRRYSRSLDNLRKALELADDATLYDNSTFTGFTEVAVKTQSGYVLYEPLPDWAEFLRAP